MRVKLWLWVKIFTEIFQCGIFGNFLRISMNWKKVSKQDCYLNLNSGFKMFKIIIIIFNLF